MTRKHLQNHGLKRQATLFDVIRHSKSGLAVVELDELPCVVVHGLKI